MMRQEDTSNCERMCDTSVQYMKDLRWDIATWELSSDIWLMCLFILLQYIKITLPLQ